MIEFILLMIGLAMACGGVWISIGVTSCQRELKSLERRVNALCSDVMECQIKTDKLEREAVKQAKQNIEMIQWIRKDWQIPKPASRNSK